jgi:hypothetical protein
MRELSETEYTEQELQTVLSRYNAEIIEVDGIYNLYIDDKWKGNSAYMKGVIIYINLLIRASNDKRDEEARQKESLARAMQGASKAVLIDDLDNPVAFVDTNARGGGNVPVAGLVTKDGDKVNVKYYRVSRNKRYFNNELFWASPKLDQLGDVFYML